MSPKVNMLTVEVQVSLRCSCKEKAQKIAQRKVGLYTKYYHTLYCCCLFLSLKTLPVSSEWQTAAWRGSLSTTVKLAEEALHTKTLAGENKVPIQSIPLNIRFVSGSWTARHCHDDSRLKTYIVLLLLKSRGMTLGWRKEERRHFSQAFWCTWGKGGSTASWFDGCRPAMTSIFCVFFSSSPFPLRTPPLRKWSPINNETNVKTA